MTEDETPESDEEQRPRTETEDLMEAQLIQEGDFDEDELPDGLYFGKTVTSE